MRYKLRVNGIVEESIVDGPGLRFVVFTQGCPHRCPGCHNPDTHAPEGGRLAETAEILARFMENPLLHGMTFSGGEPYMQPDALCFLAEQVKASGKSLVVYTGYTCEALTRWSRQQRSVARLLELTDLLIDGPYLEELRDLELPYRGSRNQRLLYREDIREIARQDALSFQPPPRLDPPRAPDLAEGRKALGMEHPRPFSVW